MGNSVGSMSIHESNAHGPTRQVPSPSHFTKAGSATWLGLSHPPAECSVSTDPQGAVLTTHRLMPGDEGSSSCRGEEDGERC